MKIFEYDEEFCDECGEFVNTAYRIKFSDDSNMCTLCKKCLLKLMYAIIER